MSFRTRNEEKSSEYDKSTAYQAHAKDFSLRFEMTSLFDFNYLFLKTHCFFALAGTLDRESYAKRQVTIGYINRSNATASVPLVVQNWAGHMYNNLKIIPITLLDQYHSDISDDLQSQFNNLTDAELSTDTFSFYTSVASVFSSKIEGEEIELDSYIKHKKFGVDFQPDYTRKIDDLYNAYTFAKTNTLNKSNIAQAHQLLTKNILAKHQQGKARVQNMYVSTPDGKIEYVAALPGQVESEMAKLYADIDYLLSVELNIQETFFYASLIHLVFVKIHPFTDGNGRTARLLEKWFLSQKLGPKAWFIQSEKNYYQNHQTYYNHLRALGLEYQDLAYIKALAFLLMLPTSLNLQ